MNIPKAIANGEQYIRDSEPHDLDDFIKFVQLGIEALKWVRADRGTLRPGLYKLLPGETEEES